MHRRTFVRLLAATPLAPKLQIATGLPPLKVVSRYAPAGVPGMPGPYPGRVIRVRSEKSVRRRPSTNTEAEGAAGVGLGVLVPPLSPRAEDGRPTLAAVPVRTRWRENTSGHYVDRPGSGA